MSVEVLDTSLDTRSSEDKVPAGQVKELEFLSQYLSQAMKRADQRRFLANLTPIVNKRVDTLKKQQVDLLELEAEFHRDVYELDRKYQEKKAALYAKRKQIVVGESEVPDYEKAGVSAPAKGIERALKDLELNKLVEGVPGFWLAILKYSPMLDPMVKTHDEPVLQYLTDISITTTPLPMTSFTLHFHFSENEYFKNPVLTKQYFMNYKLDPEAPLEFDGPEIIKSTGCVIDWNEGKNVTFKAVTSETGEQSTVMQESFFHYFSAPQLVGIEGVGNDTMTELLEVDFEIGHCLKEHIIPRAVMHFSGDVDDDDDSLSGCTISEGDLDETVELIDPIPEVDAEGDH